MRTKCQTYIYLNHNGNSSYYKNYPILVCWGWDVENGYLVTTRVSYQIYWVVFVIYGWFTPETVRRPREKKSC